MEMVVVFPAPLPPSRPVTPPRGTEKEIASTAVTDPPPGVGNRLVRLSARMAGVAELGMGTGVRESGVRWVMKPAYDRRGHEGQGSNDNA